MRLSEFVSAGRVVVAQKKHMQGPKEINKYYEACMKRYGDTKGKSYCARVAWSIYCQHVRPDDPSCSPETKTPGPPYSSPLSG